MVRILRSVRTLTPAVFLLLSACAEKEQSPFDPDADREAPSLVALNVTTTSDQTVVATWEASEPVRAVVEFQQRTAGTRHSGYSGSREFATSGTVELVNLQSGTLYQDLGVRMIDRAGNRTPASESEAPGEGRSIEEEFTTGTLANEGVFFFAMIDVGWGDALYLEAPDGTNCLIDAGHPLDGDVVRRFLEDQLDVHELDFASMSHVHNDHIGGFYGESFDDADGLLLLNDAASTNDIFPVGTFLDILDKTPNSVNNPYSTLVGALAGMGNLLGAHVLLPAGVSSDTEPALRWGGDSDKMRVDLLAAGRKDFLLPDHILSAQAGSVQNNDSMVYRVQFGEFVMLLMGDGEFATEQYLQTHYPLDFLRASVLKLGHHGSNDSNSERFINVVDPIVGLITNAVSENPGVEHPFVLTRLLNRGTDYFASDRVIANRDRAESGVRGDVLIYTKGTAFTIVADNVNYE